MRPCVSITALSPMRPTNPLNTLLLTPLSPNLLPTRLIFSNLLCTYVRCAKLPLRRLGGRPQRKSVGGLKMPAKSFVNDDLAAVKSMGHHLLCRRSTAWLVAPMTQGGSAYLSPTFPGRRSHLGYSPRPSSAFPPLLQSAELSNTGQGVLHTKQSTSRIPAVIGGAGGIIG